MRRGVFAHLCVIGLLLGCQASAPPPPVARPPAPAPPPAAAPAPRDRSDEVVALALRRYLLQLLPCNRDAGDLDLLVTIANDGSVRAAQPGESSVPPETARCVVDRVAAWRFPDLRPSSRDLRLSLSFPLQPPSLQEHVAVRSSGGRVDVEAVTRELRRLRPRVLACYKARPEPGVLLLWVHLGSWGRLLGHGVEIDSGEAVVSKAHRDKERGCLKRALRLAEFPNPDGDEVELRYPYVLGR